MLKNLLVRLRQGHRTVGYPAQEPTLPARFRGQPALELSRCPEGCSACVDACPTQAIDVGVGPGKLRLDLGRCLFCAACESACPNGAIRFSRDHRLAASGRADLIVGDGEESRLARTLDEKMRRLFGRSLKLRQVCAGGCGACEADLNVLTTVVFDIGRFGIEFVASPRHADGLIVTGPVTRNMRHALAETYAAVPQPKIVIAVGACAISGGPFEGHAEVHDGVSSVLPVDLYIPGCPPHPITILDGLLRLLGRLERDPARATVEPA